MVGTGATDTGADGGPSDPAFLSRVVPQQRGGLLRPGAAGHHRPLAGRLGAQAGAAGEAVGEPTSRHFDSCVQLTRAKTPCNMYILIHYQSKVWTHASD